ncbi:beta-ketoacyl-ACP synthase III [Flavihumibacter profundi]|uniref:beta-ketoacyl-ACP synthase III n=1 Tax=Flavihumibacter profundi TaxID=2716883 RepID=UPI001CC4804E|nr:beta-ketoacyl-ACP synthase III [Flavihumibacter profundi]MBZ5859133.1 beta-ketoacyl-ACP synthase III [Flavihumibacter profundi]
MGDVYVNRLSKFLPNDPVSNDDIELYLGMVDGKPSRARLKILGNNKITSRYYAIDKNGKSTHTNAQLAAKAIEGLFDDIITKNDIELLTGGTMSPEQLLPSHTAMVHGELGCPPIEIASLSSSCASGFQALKYAFLSVKNGDINNAVAFASEKVSTWLRHDKFDAEAEKLKELESNPIIAFEKDFMRWMLSDGAGAALVQNAPNKEGLSLRVDFIDIKSYANELPTCMYSGAIRNPNGTLTGFPEFTPEEWGNQSIFSFKQDTRLLGVKIVPMGGLFMKEVFEKHKLTVEGITWYLPHLSSEYFRDIIMKEQEKIGLPVPSEKWFTNLTRVGNVGSVSPFLMLEEMFNGGKLKKGDTLLVMIPESARFSYIYAHFTVV